MRILYLADIRFPLERANGIQTMETCYALAERGHTVLLLVRPDTATVRRDPFEFYGVVPHPRLLVRFAFVPGPEPARRMAYVAQAVAAVFGARGRTDVVITRDLGVASMALRMPRALRLPLLYESHGFAPVFAATRPALVSGSSTAPSSKLRRLGAREERVWRLAEGYVTITDGLAIELAERFGRRGALAVVPDGARLSPQRRFVPPRSPATPVITFAGHLHPWKGVDVLLEALALLPAARGVIVGGHPAERDLVRLQELARTLGVLDRVTFTGFVSRAEVATRLEQADVLVMPHTATPVSERYASPLKLFEYLASGKPIVASDLASIREVLRDGENACLVKPDDPQSLATGIAKVLGDLAFSERIARCGFEDALAYTWARRAERIERVLDTMLERS